MKNNTKHTLHLGNKKLDSRLLLGTGKFNSPEVMKQTIESSQTNMITVAVRRIDFNDNQDPFISHIDLEKYILLPNTAGARNAEEAIRCAKIARSLSKSNFIKL